MSSKSMVFTLTHFPGLLTPCRECNSQPCRRSVRAARWHDLNYVSARCHHGYAPVGSSAPIRQRVPASRRSGPSAPAPLRRTRSSLHFDSNNQPVFVADAETAEMTTHLVKAQYTLYALSGRTPDGWDGGRIK